MLSEWLKRYKSSFQNDPKLLTLFDVIKVELDPSKHLLIITPAFILSWERREELNFRLPNITYVCITRWKKNNARPLRRGASRINSFYIFRSDISILSHVRGNRRLSIPIYPFRRYFISFDIFIEHGKRNIRKRNSSICFFCLVVKRQKFCQ